MPKNVFITRKIPQGGIDLLIRKGFNVEVFKEDRSILKEELLSKIKTTDALLPLLTDEISAEIIQAGEKLKIIANHAVGFNNIDLEEATRRKIVVTNTPGILTEATADLTMALMLSISKRIVEGDFMTRSGKFHGWDPLLLLGSEISGKTIGIIGAGRIGAAVAKRASGFGMKILYSDNVNSKYIDSDLKGKKVLLTELLENSDYVSIHVPLTDSTFHLIDRVQLLQMKNSAFLINTSRGAVVNEAALVEALSNKWIAGAGLDVYEFEPKLTDGLAELKNTVLLPHIGSATLETRTKMAIMAAKNIITFFEGKKPPNIINPEAF